jgi:uncharacterized protein
MSLVVRLTLFICALLLAPTPASAATVADLYEISVPLDSGQDAAFLDALKAVSIRVSGQRDAATRLGVVTNARQYAQRFGTANRMLQVGFDSVAIDKLLSTAGLPIWGRERPATLVLLNIREADGSSRWADAQFGSVEREAVTKVARQRGLPLIWPSVDAQEQSRIQQAGFSAAALLQIAERFGANATLLGYAQRGSANSLSVRWVLAAEDGATELESVLEEGVHLAADTFARTYGASASSVDNVLVEISGIANLSAYAAAVNYLEAMTVVRSVALEQLSGDILRLRLAVRGDANTLRRAVTLDKRLVPQVVNSPDAVVRPASLQFRYQP